MADRYYTPKISEFHVGFEYEITNGYDWVKKTFSQQDFNTFLYQNLESAIDQNFVRVKYLDRVDVESFGGLYQSEGNFNIKGKLRTQREYNIQLYRMFGDTLVSIKTVEDQIYNFIGNIKNKSELGRILQQLEIL